MAWIGPVGRLFEFKCPSAVESTPADTRVLFTSMAGRVSVTDTGAGQAPRSWQVQVDAAIPEAVAALQALSYGEFGPGPFAWVPPAAHTLNLLGRGAAVCRGSHIQQPEVTTGPAVATSEGWAGRSLLRNAAPHVVLGNAPVLPGRVVAARVWAVGPTQVRITPYNTGGQPLAASTSAVVDTGTGGWVTHSMVAPGNGAHTQVDVLGATSVTRPSITWDAPARVWSPSKASLSVSVAPVTESLVRATGIYGAETLAGYGFTIQEVG